MPIYPLAEKISDGVPSSILSGSLVVTEPLTAPLLNSIECHNATGSTITAKSVCYISGDSSGVPEITKAQADAEANAKGMLVVVLADILDGGQGTCSMMGIVSGFSGLTPGAIQYLSDDTAGSIEETATTTSTEIVRICGYALSATVVYFNPMQAYVEVP